MKTEEILFPYLNLFFDVLSSQRRISTQPCQRDESFEMKIDGTEKYSLRMSMSLLIIFKI